MIRNKNLGFAYFSQTLIVHLLLLLEINSCRGTETTSCALDDGETGQCVQLKQCRHAIFLIRNGVSPVYCNYENEEVCCEISESDKDRVSSISESVSPDSKNFSEKEYLPLSDSYLSNENPHSEEGKSKEATEADFDETTSPNYFSSESEIDDKTLDKRSSNYNNQFIPPGQSKKKLWKNEKTRGNNYNYEYLTKPNINQGHNNLKRQDDYNYEGSFPSSWEEEPYWSGQTGRETANSEENNNWFDQNDNNYNNQRATTMNNKKTQETGSKRNEYGQNGFNNGGNVRPEVWSQRTTTESYYLSGSYQENIRGNGNRRPGPPGHRPQSERPNKPNKHNRPSKPIDYDAYDPTRPYEPNHPSPPYQPNRPNIPYESEQTHRPNNNNRPSQPNEFYRPETPYQPNRPQKPQDSYQPIRPDPADRPYKPVNPNQPSKPNFNESPNQQTDSNQFSEYPNNNRPGQPKRISELKCQEYSKEITQQIAGLPLTTDPDPVIISVRKCVQAQQLIVGGENTTVGEFPHMAAIGFRDRNKQGVAWNCGGTLISDLFVLTAAHCTSTSSGRPVKVRLGEYNLIRNDDGAHPVDYGVAEVIPHPDYKPPSKYNDIGLLKLSRRVSFQKHIRPACLYLDERLSSSKAVATGWGRIFYDGTTSDVLQKVVLNIVDKATCNRLYKVNVKTEVLSKGIIDSQLCAGELSGGKDTCQGDSGGPLTITNTKCIHHIIGITSFGKSCALPNSTGVYTKISAYISWIESIVWPSE